MVPYHSLHMPVTLYLDCLELLHLPFLKQHTEKAKVRSKTKSRFMLVHLKTSYHEVSHIFKFVPYSFLS